MTQWVSNVPFSGGPQLPVEAGAPSTRPVDNLPDAYLPTKFGHSRRIMRGVEERLMADGPLPLVALQAEQQGAKEESRWPLRACDLESHSRSYFTRSHDAHLDKRSNLNVSIHGCTPQVTGSVDTGPVIVPVGHRSVFNCEPGGLPPPQSRQHALPQTVTRYQEEDIAIYDTSAGEVTGSVRQGSILKTGQLVRMRVCNELATWTRIS